MHWQQQAKVIHPKYYKHLKEVSKPFGDIEMGWFGQISLYIKKTQNFKKYYSKVLPHENYGDWKLRGPCRENLQARNSHGVSPQFLGPRNFQSP